jgi:hypothetical protein
MFSVDPRHDFFAGVPAAARSDALGVFHAERVTDEA